MNQQVSLEFLHKYAIFKIPWKKANKTFSPSILYSFEVLGVIFGDLVRDSSLKSRLLV